MRRRIRINWLRWLLAAGLSNPAGIGTAEVSELLARPEALTAKHKGHGDGACPPPHGPERLAAAALTPVEQDLWSCLQGDHDHRTA